jgi:hypothetical protein
MTTKDYSPATKRAMRYTRLKARDMATVTVAALRRLGKLEQGMTARVLSADEIGLLADSDFEGILE